MILVTGATGFVGSALVNHLASTSGAAGVVAAVRRTNSNLPAHVKQVCVGDLGPDTDWTPAITGATAVIHAAARVHVMRDNASDPLSEFRRVNVQGTLHFARQAAAMGVQRFVFVSSVKVNGETTEPGRPFKSDDKPSPLDPYGISKLEAERGLHEIGSSTGMQIVVVRPPLVYGPGVQANFLRLMKLVKSGIPLPLGAITNRRSMVAIENLIDLLAVCSRHPAARGQTFMVSDDHDISVAELLRMIASSMNKRLLMLPVPPGVIAGTARLLGQSALTSRLMDSLQVDIEKTKITLGWTPVASMQEAVRRTVAHFLMAAT